MELPSKKDWPTYYQEIKRPQCLENIFVRTVSVAVQSECNGHLQKHIKRKEYHTPGEFATDVELVFSNAMTFNQEKTPIWEDARALRVCDLWFPTSKHHLETFYRILSAC